MRFPPRVGEGTIAKFTVTAVLTAFIAACAGSAPARAAGPAPVTIVVFTPPSLGAIFPSVIKQQKFDIANSVDIIFVERTL